MHLINPIKIKQKVTIYFCLYSSFGIASSSSFLDCLPESCFSDNADCFLAPETISSILNNKTAVYKNLKI